MKKYICSFKNGNITSSYNCPTPKFFRQIFRDMATAYYHSCQKSNYFTIACEENIYQLLEDYLIANGQREIKSIFKKTEISTFQKESYTPNKNKVAVMFTGGKDSLHLLLRLIDVYGSENIMALYCKNINKSEASYEKDTVKEICEHLGIKYRLVEITNSIKINRANHNIGLRDQLLLSCALPYIINFKACKVYFGLHDGFVKMTPALFTSHKNAFNHLRRSLSKYGFNIEVSNHIDYPKADEIFILKDLIENHSDLFFMTNSCYTQKNFREMHHKKQQKKYKTIKLYNGCGVCLKCLRINAALYLYSEDFKKGDKKELKSLRSFIKIKQITKFPKDQTLASLVDLMHQYT